MPSKMGHDLVTDSVFCGHTMLANLVSDEFPCDTIGGVGMFTSGQVHRPLFIIPDRFKLLDQVTRRNDIRFLSPNQFNCSRIDSRNVGVSVAR